MFPSLTAKLLDLPGELITAETLTHLDPSDIINFCTSAKGILTVCQDRRFLHQYVINNYGVDINEMVVPQTNWEKFLFVNSIGRRLKEWDASDITLEHINYTYDDEDVAEYEFNLSIYPIFRSRSINLLFREIIANNSPSLLKYAINLYYDIVGSRETADKIYKHLGKFEEAGYFESFDEDVYNDYIHTNLLAPTFIEVIRKGNNKLIEAMLTRYTGQYNDGDLQHEIRNAIAGGDMDLIKKLLTPLSVEHDTGTILLTYRIDEGDVALAEKTGHIELAQFLRKMQR